MILSSDQMLSFLRGVLGYDSARPKRELGQYLAAIPTLASLEHAVPSGTPVLVRGDVDAKIEGRSEDEDVRLRSMLDTLNFGRRFGWKQIIFGHVGRKPEGSLAKVARRFSELLNCDVPLVGDWLDESTATITDSAAAAVRAAAPGSVHVLENTRKYALETCLWMRDGKDYHPADADLASLAPRLATLANECAEKFARVYVHEAFSAGSHDASSVVVPAAMDRVALGSYAAGEFDVLAQHCLKAQLVVFSGLKADKLDDLEAIVNRGQVRWVFAAGSLAMALKKAAAQLDGGQFCMGLAEDPAHAQQPYYVSRERVEQARWMIAAGRQKGIEFVLPVDFVLQDGRTSDAIGPADQQFDVGPKSQRHFADQVAAFIAATRGRDGVAFHGVTFHNGVFGKFEDEKFAGGTRHFMGQLKAMKDAGVRVYVGGGEGGAALKRYAKSDWQAWVTHCFTAGGTVLNALGSEPVPYLVALSQAAR